MLKLNIDQTSQETMTEQIAAQISGAIARGELNAGDTLPSERSLSEELGMNRKTIRRAYRLLVKQKMLETMGTRGYRVRTEAGTRKGHARFDVAPENRVPDSVSDQTTGLPLLVRVRPVFEMDDSKFADFRRINRDLRIEMTAAGDLVIMPPRPGRTGNLKFKIAVRFGAWVEHEGTGVGFDSSTTFALPNGNKRSPDVSWVRKSRLASMTNGQRECLLRLCPDFVIELRSSSESITDIQDRMQDYLANGARLGWLIDPEERRVHIYQKNEPVMQLDDPEMISGEPVLPGFTLKLRELWEADF